MGDIDLWSYIIGGNEGWVKSLIDWITGHQGP
jgi:hypothetical protein